MEEKIPEAKEWLKHHLHSSQIDAIEDCMLKFAKLHVQAALKAVYTNPKVNIISQISVLDIYPLINIK